MLSTDENFELNRKISDSCVLVVQSCDAYEDVWSMFFSALSEHWPGCNLNIILNTETKTTTFGNLKINKINYNCNLTKPFWGERLLNILKNIERDFIIVLFDDFILEEDVNLKKINYCIDMMNSNSDIGVFYFNNNPEAKIKSLNGFSKLGKFADYKVNSSPAIWRKTVLQEMTSVIDNPWAWEFFGSARAYGDKYEFHCSVPDEEDTFVYQYQLGGAIRRGKWVEAVILPAIKKYNLPLNPSIRGFSSESLSEGKYSFSWKVNFIRLGFKMVGFRAIIPLLKAILHKARRIFS